MDLSDTEIEMSVRDALVADPYVTDPAIEVRASAGVVTLEGQVGSAMRRRRAEEVARQVPGVVKVRNHLHVLTLRDHAYEVEHLPPPEEMV